MADIFDRCASFLEEQRIASPDELLVARRILFDVSPIDNAGPWMDMNGRRVLQFSTNDYLGLSIHPEVRAVAAEYADIAFAFQILAQVMEAFKPVRLTGCPCPAR